MKNYPAQNVIGRMRIPAQDRRGCQANACKVRQIIKTQAVQKLSCLEGKGLKKWAATAQLQPIVNTGKQAQGGHV